MTSHNQKSLLSFFALLILLSLACRLPETGTSTPITPTITPTPTAGIHPGMGETQAALTSTPKIRPTSPPAVEAHRIAIHRIFGLAALYDRTTSTDFIPRGVSYFLLVPVQDHYEDHLLEVGLYDHKRVQEDFATLSAAGYNTVRVLVDGCTSGDACIGQPNSASLNQAYLDNLTDLLSLAKANQLFVLLASQGLPASYQTLADQGANASIAAGRNSLLLSQSGIQASRQYWSDLLAGLADRQAAFDVILGWELLAEQYFQSDQPPFSLKNGRITLANNKSYDIARPAQREALAVDGLRYYIDQVKQAIQVYDPTALVTMGFLAPDSPNAWREGDDRYVVIAPLLGASSLDFFDLHANPGSGLTMAELAQNYGLGEHVTSPVIMSEVGASTWVYPELPEAAIAIQDWIASSCAKGFSGWLYSSYYPYPAGLSDASWGFVDQKGLMLNALSPRSQPDACSVSVLPGRNLALGKPVQVSASLPEQSPEMAVDGDPNTQWSAGDFPSQWIEIDLGSTYSIGELRLTVGQWPDGQTVHQLWVGTTRDKMRQVDEFSGHTYDFDILSYTPNTPLYSIRYIRLETTESPSWVSWREIEVLAPFPATPTPVPTPTETPTP